MGELTTDQTLVLVRDTAFVVLWAVTAFAVVPRLKGGEWAKLALLGSLLLLATSGLSLVQAKFLFVDQDPSLILTLADWHLTWVPTLLTFIGSALVVKALLGRREAGRTEGPEAPMVEG